MFSYSASRAWPQLFPSHRRIPLQTKRNIADEQMCFKNGRSTRPPVCLPGGFTHQHGSWRVRMELDANTQGELITTCVNTHVQTHWQRYAETCIHTHTQIWIFYVQIIKERWLQTERMHCCQTWTNTWWRTKMYRAREQVSPPKTEKKNPFRQRCFEIGLSKGIPSHTLTFQQVIILCVCLSFSSDACQAWVTHSDT